MAKDDPASTSAAPSSKEIREKPKKSNPRSMMPYLVAAVLACGAMAWYFFVFVPTHLEYFVGSRFRTLGVASGQIRSKVDNLQKALEGARSGVLNVPSGNPAALTGDYRDNFEKYVRALVPEIQLFFGKDASVEPRGFHFDTRSFKDLSAFVAWDDIVTEAAVVSARDFDDLILADPSGRIVWQREKTTARIGNISELLNAESEPVGWLPVSLSWGVHTTVPKVEGKAIPTTVVLKPVSLNGRPSFLLVQSIQLSDARGPYYAAGLVAQKTLRQEAMYIPTVWVVLVTLPVVLLFLSLPFVKLATLTPKERYSFVDIVLLAATTVMAAGIGAVLIASPPSFTEPGDRNLAAFADDIETRLKKETEEILDLAVVIQKEKPAIENTLKPCAVPLAGALSPETKETLPQARCGLWESLNLLKGDPQRKTTIAWDKVSPGSLELDVVVWVNSKGEQSLKWTTKAQVTGPTSHTSFDHFRDIRDGRTWVLANRPNDPFTIEPLRAPTTAEMGVIFALPSEPQGSSFVLNVRPQSLVDPALPPGYGFAVLAPSGKVLFHSDETLSLEENFFEELGDGSGLREKAESGRRYTWSDDYHGRPHRLFLRPMTEFIGCPWRIVTFQPLEPVLASEFRQQIGIFRFGVLNTLGLMGLALFFWFRSKWSKYEIRDVAMSMFSVESHSRQALWNSIRLLVGLAVLGVVSGYLLDAQLDWLYLFLLPSLAISAAIAGRKLAPENRKPDRDRDSFLSKNRLLAIELALLVLLVAVFPAVGFTRIVVRFQTLQQTERLLQATQQRLSERQNRIRTRVNRASYTPETRQLLTAEITGFAGPWSDERSKLDSYVGVLSKVHETPASRVPTRGTPESKRAGMLLRSEPRVRKLLEWGIPLSTDESNNRDAFDLIEKEPGMLRLNPEVPELPALKADYANAEPPGFWHFLFGVVILISVVSAVQWASTKLAVTPVVRAPTLEDQWGALSKNRNEGILLIGPPRTNKDHIVQETMKPHLRIRLLDADLSEDFLEQTLQDVGDLMVKSNGLAGHPSGRGPLHIHLSNLESHLVKEDSRKGVLRLLEKLLHWCSPQPHKVLIVTSSVDPIAHFKEIFEQERKGIYKDAVPEVELCRSSLILSRFRRCYAPLGRDKLQGQPPDRWDGWLNYRADKWADTARREVQGCEALGGIVEELQLAWDENSNVQLEDLAAAIRAKASAYYELLWASCTRSEKLVLIQLAQEGFANPRSRDLVTQLVAKGLIVERPAPRVFNYTFRAFLRGIERNNVVHEWEQMEGTGLWVLAGRLIGSSLVAGGIFYLVTQGFSIQSLLPIVSGTGVFGVPLVRDLVARLPGRSKGAVVDTA